MTLLLALSTCPPIFLLRICLSLLLILLKLIAWLVFKIMDLMFGRLLCPARHLKNIGPRFTLSVRMEIAVEFMPPFHPRLANQPQFLDCISVGSRLTFLFVTLISFHLSSSQEPICRFLVTLRRKKKILFSSPWNGI